MTSIAVLGTGLLGSGFVENLLQKGHTVRIWNRSPDKLAPLAERGASPCSDPADAARGAERVHLVLSEDDAVDSVVAALRPGLGDGVPILDHSTNLPARVKARYEALRAESVRYLHAPVFMAPQNARDATGLMVLSGPQAEADALMEPLSEMTGKVWHCGEQPELAAFHKLAGNGLFLAMTGVLGDMLAMGKNSGLSPDAVLELFSVFKPGDALAFFGERVAKAESVEPSFELTMARKDVRLMLEAAGDPSQLTVLPAVANRMDRAIESGLGDRDFVVFARADL